MRRLGSVLSLAVLAAVSGCSYLNQHAVSWDWEDEENEAQSQPLTLPGDFLVDLPRPFVPGSTLYTPLLDDQPDYSAEPTAMADDTASDPVWPHEEISAVSEDIDNPAPLPEDMSADDAEARFLVPYLPSTPFVACPPPFVIYQAAPVVIVQPEYIPYPVYDSQLIVISGGEFNHGRGGGGRNDGGRGDDRGQGGRGGGGRGQDRETSGAGRDAAQATPSSQSFQATNSGGFGPAFGQPSVFVTGNISFATGNIGFVTGNIGFVTGNVDAAAMNLSREMQMQEAAEADNVVELGRIPQRAGPPSNAGSSGSDGGGGLGVNAPPVVLNSPTVSVQAAGRFPQAAPANLPRRIAPRQAEVQPSDPVVRFPLPGAVGGTGAVVTAAARGSSGVIVSPPTFQGAPMATFRDPTPMRANFQSQQLPSSFTVVNGGVDAAAVNSAQSNSVNAGSSGSASAGKARK